MKMLKCIIVSIRLRTHKIKRTRHLIGIIAKMGHQMDIIDLEVETKDAKILPYGCPYNHFKTALGNNNTLGIFMTT
jgi:hypothetical protein